MLWRKKDISKGVYGVNVGAGTHAGRVREKNEDAYYAIPPLLAVADGMGGHAAGEIASHLAVNTLATWSSWDDPETDLWQCIQQANAAIYQYAHSKHVREGMGTTLTAVHLSQETLYWAHVGDSRLYVMRDGDLMLQTQDHSVVAELQRSGNLTESEARLHPHRNVLTRALGIDETVDIDRGSLQLRHGDRILLCTDGLHGCLSEEHIAHILAETDQPQLAVTNLIRQANQNGGPDNITAIVADITGGDPR
ncbi:MAG: Stp1/IreP family PP2C-type Ser/Thr phosphatase [Firmicutes bacterium]|mgnify:CR=1 FL=1|jgi:protein phosphatase|nr:Stp1/IreP family PP2C-type Ser/Thr phosphatase [Bacillota bacterium]